MGSFIINTTFDKSKQRKYSALKSHITNLDSSKSHEVVLFETGREKPISLYNANKNVEFIKKLITEHTVFINDFKQHIRVFNLPFRDYDAYDFDENPVNTKEIWRRLRANASQIYQSLEDRSIYINDELAKTEWSLDTYSGRSKNLTFNLQGLQGGEEILNPHCDSDILVNFDWMAADVRICQIFSGDEILADAFENSDPYAKVLEIVNIPEFTRDEAKIGLISGINSTDHTSIIVGMFPKLAEWLKKCQADLDNNGYLESILGRRFVVSEDRSQKSVINAIQQGSVAHAMQNTLVRLWEEFGKSILVETHDSLTICANKDNIKNVINSVTSVMCRPFDGFLSYNPMFPVQVRVGKKFKRWNSGLTIRK